MSCSDGVVYGMYKEFRSGACASFLVICFLRPLYFSCRVRVFIYFEPHSACFARSIVFKIFESFLLFSYEQVSYLTLAASLSVVLLPLRLIAPAIFVPPLARAWARIRGIGASAAR
jgi:hypothetical protein